MTREGAVPLDDPGSPVPRVWTWDGGRALDEGSIGSHLLILWDADEPLNITLAPDERGSAHLAKRGDVSFLAAASFHRIEAPSVGNAIVVGIPPCLLLRAAGSALDPRAAAGGRRPRTADVLRWLARRQAAGLAHSPLVDLLLARLAAVAFCGMVRRPDDAWLPPATLQRVHHLARSGGTMPTLTTLAAMAGLGVSAFSRGFRGSTGITPGDFLVGVRMDAVAHLLTTTELPLPVIANAVGMSSVAHANQQFRARHGVTLGSYREAARHRSRRPSAARRGT